MQLSMSRKIETTLLRLYLDVCQHLPPEGITVEFPAGKSIITFSIATEVEPAEQPLTACERNIVDLLDSVDRKMTGKEIMAALETRGQLWGKSTILNALASLVARKKLMNEHDGRGYARVRSQHFPLADEPGDESEDASANANANAKSTHKDTSTASPASPASPLHLNGFTRGAMVNANGTH